VTGVFSHPGRSAIDARRRQLVTRRDSAHPDGSDEGPCAGRRWHTSTGRGSRPVAGEHARVGDLPAVRVTAPAATAQQHQLAGLQQRLARAPVAAVSQSRSAAQLLGGETSHHAVLTREGSDARQQ
jgi:hypothetical protein